MSKLLKSFFKLDFGKHSNPLKYRETNYTLAELERRLTAEINGWGGRY